MTNANGGFSFPLLGVTLNTQYRVLMPQNQDVQSPIVALGVAPRVSASAKRGPAHAARRDRPFPRQGDPGP